MQTDIDVTRQAERHRRVTQRRHGRWRDR